MKTLSFGYKAETGDVYKRQAHSDPAYASRLFDAGRVHTIDIQIENWQAFLAAAPQEEYSPCTVVVDGERFEQVGLRAKGNNSRRLIEEYGLSRYSLKLEFDHYQTGASYHGLDKLSLDCSFQDNSYLKNHTAYRMMDYMGVPAPLSSYVWVTVNGQDWGLFLAVEEPEEAFARRNFGPDHGQLYKPDYKSLSAENPDVALRYTGPVSYTHLVHGPVRLQLHPAAAGAGVQMCIRDRLHVAGAGHQEGNRVGGVSGEGSAIGLAHLVGVAVVGSQQNLTTGGQNRVDDLAGAGVHSLNGLHSGLEDAGVADLSLIHI